MAELDRPGPEPARTPQYLQAVRAAAQHLADAARAPGTRRAYDAAWRAFQQWCVAVGQDDLPATEATLGAYLAHLDLCGAAHPTAVRHLAAIRWKHGEAGADLPTGVVLRTLMAGYARRHGRAPRGQAQGLRTAHVRRIVATLDPARPRDVRDRAIILLGFAAGFRRSELAALDVADVSDHPDGLLVVVRRSKADQEGRGTVKAVPYGSREPTCPVTAYRRWLAVARIEDGRVFRAVRKNGAVWGEGLSDQVIADVVRQRALAAGMAGRWSGHSLRRGFATEAAAGGVPRQQIMQDGGWRSTAVDAYITAGARFGERAGSHLGL